MTEGAAEKRKTRALLKRMYSLLFKSFGPQHWWPAETRFEVAVGAVLTQNTNWGNVERAIENLKAAKALTPAMLHKMPASELAPLIRPAGYFNVKARRLKSFVAFLVSQYRGSMERMAREEEHSLRVKLMAINGVGPETADSILLYGLDKPMFVIDAYTKRVLSRHGMLEIKDSYDYFQALFHSCLKKDVRMYNEYHALLVMAGKHYCRPKTPRCGQCPLEGAGI